MEYLSCDKTVPNSFHFNANKIVLLVQNSGAMKAVIFFYYFLFFCYVIRLVIRVARAMGYSRKA